MIDRIVTRMSEATKHLQHFEQYLKGSGINIGSGGDPVVPWAIQVELPQDEFASYTGGHSLGPEENIELRGFGHYLYWFNDDVLDFVLASHLLQDFELGDWPDTLREWIRVLRPGGYLIVLVPDRERWERAIQGGQQANPRHLHESHPGELTTILRHTAPMMCVLYDEIVDDGYSILLVARKDTKEEMLKRFSERKAMREW